MVPQDINPMSVTMITVANFAETGTKALHRYVEGTLPY